MDDCVFCKIIRGEIPSDTIFQTDAVIVFVSLHGDPLVVPKKHIENIYSLDSETGALLMTEIVRTANAVKKGLGCDGISITQSNDAAGGQEVFHIHFHVYPRWNDATKNKLVMVSADERQLIREKVATAYN